MSPEQVDDAVVVRRSVLVRGRPMSYLAAGPADGAPVVLIHGLLSDSTTFDTVLPELARHGVRAIAPDLPGSGESDRFAGDGHALPHLAKSVERFMDALQLDTATLVGHSLGGGVAIGVSYLFPARVDRLVLVASGGFGTDLHPVLRAATLPGAPIALRFAAGRTARRVLADPRLHRALRLERDTLVNLTRIARGLRTDDGRDVFFSTLRESIDRRGQRGAMFEMGYVDADLPTLLIWSRYDPIIPVRHAHVAEKYLNRARLVLLPGAGHEPHRRHPATVAEHVAAFTAEHD